MNIVFVEIQNFRKLKPCRVEIASQETIFVGANNSGKTSAMDSMILFLKKSRRNDIATTDFTLSNWSHINQIGMRWISAENDNVADITSGQWLSVYMKRNLYVKHRVMGPKQEAGQAEQA